MKNLSFSEMLQRQIDKHNNRIRKSQEMIKEVLQRQNEKNKAHKCPTIKENTESNIISLTDLCDLARTEKND